MIQINLKPLSNTDIANSNKVTEGAIRYAKNNNKDLYEEYKIKTQKKISAFEEINNDKRTLKKLTSFPILKQIQSTRKGIKTKEITKLFTILNTIEIADLKEEYRELASPSVISVTNRKGGVGKTTNSLNIGTMLSFIGFNVLFIDYDTQANASQTLGLRPNINIEKNIIDLVLEVGKGQLEKEDLKKYIFHLQENLKTKGKFDVIPNSGTIENQEKAITIANELIKFSTSYTALKMLISQVKDDYDFIIMDTPPNDIDSLTMITNATDYFIFSYKPEQHAAEGTAMLFQTLKEQLEPAYKMTSKKHINIIGGIISDYNSNIGIQQILAEQIEEDFNSYSKKYGLSNTIFKQRITHLQKFTKIQESRQYGSLISPNSLKEKLSVPEQKTIRDYLDIVKNLIERIIIDLYQQQD